MKEISYTAAINEPLITAEQEAIAIKNWQEKKDQKALEILIKSHARIAYSMANRYTNNTTHMEDLAADGIIGLMKAADKFDPSRGTRFATYSRWWVMTCITQALPKVTQTVDISARTLIDSKMGRLEGPEKDRARAAVFGVIQLDAPISDDEGMTAIDLLECPQPNPEEASQIKSDADYRREMLMGCMSELNDRERQILIRRKLANQSETLEQISSDIGVTRERVRQIESRAMAKLKRSLMSKGFSVSMLRE